MPLTPMRKRFEVASIGIDENLQLIGSDYAFGQNSMGLRIPGLANTSANRYLFLLASAVVPAGSYLTGIRQFLTMGRNVQTGPNYLVEFPITTPNWRFVDGNVSWYVNFIPLTQWVPKAGTADMTNLAFRQSFASALLYETVTIPATGKDYYVNLTAYTPPYGGAPPGRALDTGLAPIFDMRWPWTSPQANTELRIPLTQPGVVALFASVRQTNTSSRVLLTKPNQIFPYEDGIPPEELFLANYNSAIYWRIGGSLVFDMEVQS